MWKPQSDQSLRSPNKETWLEDPSQNGWRLRWVRMSLRWSRHVEPVFALFVFVLRVYGPFNPMGSCQTRSVYLNTLLLGKLSPLSSSPVFIPGIFSFRFCRPCGVRIRNLLITKTCLYNVDPLKPHFYIVKLGFTGVYIIFFNLLKNIDCGYSLEPPRRGGSNGYPQSMFWAEMWHILEFFIWKFSVFGGDIFYIFE